jgi:hypothetical protein
MSLPLLSTAASLAALLLTLVDPSIRWEPSLAEALERAARERKVLFLAINMDGERANDETAETIYTDPEIIRLTGHTVNVVASRHEHRGGMTDCRRLHGIPCHVHRKVDAEMREAGIVKATKKGYVIAPQHVWLDPEGRVLLSVPYFITKEEMEWCFVTAIREVDPDFEASLPPEAGPPERLVRGGVHDPEASEEGNPRERGPRGEGGPGGSGPRPYPREELREAIESLRETGDEGYPPEVLRRVLVTGEPEAIAFVRDELGSRGSARADRRGAIRLIREAARWSPPPFWRAFDPLLRDEDEAIRSEAAVALEQIAAPESRKSILAALGAERSVTVKKNLLRALGATTREDSTGRRILARHAVSAREEILRVNALVALAGLAPHPEVEGALERALRGGGSHERIASACAVAIARYAALEEPLAAACEHEKDRGAADTLRRALAVLRGGDPATLDDAIRTVAQDRIPRPRPSNR